MDHSVVSFEQVRVPVDALLGDHATIQPDGSRHDPLGGPRLRERRSLRIRDAARVWIEQQLLGMERVDLERSGRPRPVDQIAVVATTIGHGGRDAAMPDATGLVGQWIEDDLGARPLDIVAEQQQPHGRGVLRVEREVVGALRRARAAAFGVVGRFIRTGS